MAEGDVFINGLGPGVPQWSTEATLNQVKAILQKENMLTQQVVKSIEALAKGDATARKQVAQSTQQAAQENAKATQELVGTVKESVAEEKKSFNIFSNISKGISRLIQQEQLSQEFEKSRARKLESILEKKNLAAGMDPAQARQKAKFDAVTQGVKDGGMPGFTDLLGAAAKLSVASEGFNAFLGQGFEDRFNLANEIRQSGLMAGLDMASSGVQGFAETVRNSNFTLGQAAEFVKTFSRAVGITGVEAALDFVNSMAYTRFEEDGTRISGMMEKFGMDFRQVSIMSGEYLDSLRSANMLGQLTERQMQQGMTDFMEGVQATSNVLKISLEESAKMISDRLQRDDIAGFLALMDDQKRQQTQAALANVGLNDGSAIGEAIIKRIAMGGQGFLLSDERAQLMQTGQGQELVRLIEQVGMVADSGGDVQAAVAEFMQGAGQMVDSNQGSEATNALMARNFGNLQKMFTEIQQFRATTDDITKGAQELTEPDKAQVLKDDIQRRAVVTIEGLVTTQMPAFADTLKDLNRVNSDTITLLDKTGQNLAPLASAFTEGAGLVTETTRKLVNSILFLGEKVTGATNSVFEGASEFTGFDQTGIGLRTQDAGEAINTEKSQEQSNQQLDIKTGRERLEDSGGVLSFLDNDAENMFDEIISALARGPNADLSSEASELASLIGFNDFNNNFEANQKALLDAIEAVKTTDEFKAEGGQEKLQKLIEAITMLDGTYKSIPLIRGEEKTARMNEENIADREKLIGKIEQLISTIKNE